MAASLTTTTTTTTSTTSTSSSSLQTFPVAELNPPVVPARRPGYMFNGVKTVAVDGVDHDRLLTGTWGAAVLFQDRGCAVAADWQVHLWRKAPADSWANAQLARRLLGHTDFITSVSLRAGSDVAASGAQDGVVKLWDLKAGAELRSHNEHRGEVWAVAQVGPRHVLSGDDGGTLLLWCAGVCSAPPLCVRITRVLCRLSDSERGTLLFPRVCLTTNNSERVRGVCRQGHRREHHNPDSEVSRRCDGHCHNDDRAPRRGGGCCGAEGPTPEHVPAKRGRWAL